MDDSHDGAYAREPQLADLARLLRSLDADHVRDVLTGGFAAIPHCSVRATKDMDLLIDASPENVAGVC